MAKRLSQYFSVPAEELHKRGVFNGFLGIDSKLFIDPNLLKVAKAPEFAQARADLDSYFNDVIKLLGASKATGDLPWREAEKRLVFREQSGVALGYSNAGGYGSGIGPELGAQLVQRGSEIVALGITDPAFFELIGLFEERFGPDRLSDMTIVILLTSFLAFTQRIVKELNLKPNRIFRVNGTDWQLPTVTDETKALVLVPEELLSDLPVALDRSEITQVAAFNEQIRRVWNALFAAAQRRKSSVSKPEIREMLFSNPKGFADLIKVYKGAVAHGYDFEKDPEGLFEWFELGHDIAKQYPVKIDVHPKSTEDIMKILDAIVCQFKKNIEDNRLYEMLYRDDGRPRKEVFSQRLFYAIADAYCSANRIELSREPNAGNGPVDFKLSDGTGRVLVEVKLSSNDLLHGYTVQLPAYQASEKAADAIYLIIRVTEGDSGIKSVVALEAKTRKAGKPTPRVYVVDARETAAASKR